MAGAPVRLRCETLHDPIGLGEVAPRLSWWLDDERAAEVQTAYHILAASSPALLDDDSADVWDSGVVTSPQTAYVEFGGTSLVSMQRVWWKVRSFDSDGVATPWSAHAFFEMGLLDTRDWRAQWIGTPLMGGRRTPTRVPLLRYAFELTRPVERARLYVTALGIYDVEINGSRAIDIELAPGWTDFRRRVRYQTFDVSDLLQVGDNAIGAWLGDGWYCGTLGLSQRQQYGDRPALLAQLEVILADGTPLVIGTDAQWRWQQSETLYADLIDGESVDGRQRLQDFTRRGYDSSAWQAVDIVEPPGGVLDADAGPHVRIIERHEARLLKDIEGAQGQRIWLFDVGTNIVGRARLELRAPAASHVQLRYGERLDARGELYTANLRDARATDCYTCGGADEGESFEPRFTVHGFQYVEVTAPESVSVDRVIGMVLGSSMDPLGRFECDDDLVNGLQRNILRSQLGNFLDVPTSGPQRDERLGWTGPAQAFVRTATFNLDVSRFYSKWLTDLCDAQFEAGMIPPVAPLPPDLVGLRIDGGPAFADAIVICPWTIYRCCGDRRILEDNYAAMTSFIEGLEARFPDLIRGHPERTAWQGYGDWLALDGPQGPGVRHGGTPKDLIGTAFFCYSARLLARIAGVLGNLSDLERFESLAQRVRTAFRRRFVTQDGRVAAETQTGYVLALHFGLLDAEERPEALGALVRDIESRGGHPATGTVGTPYLLHVLTRHGRADVAYDVLLNRAAPGWLYPVTQGATSIWERWDGWSEHDGFRDGLRGGGEGGNPLNSFNDIAFGSVGEWLYSVMLGLDVDPDLAPTRNAYRYARIEPRPPIGEQFPGGAPIKRVAGHHDTIYGRYEVSWELSGAQFRLHVRIPPNCRASVILPDGSVQDAVAGHHDFTLALAESAEDGIPVLRRVSEPLPESRAS